MPDPRATTRVLDELLWSLRRGGFTIATSQAIDAARAVSAVGLEQREAVREALAAVIVKRPRQRRRFDAAFDAFFAEAREPRDLFERLLRRGFTAAEIDALRALLADARAATGDVMALATRGAELDRLLALARADGGLEAQNPLQVGFTTHRLLQAMGFVRARQELAALVARLRDAIGEERADALAKALADELDRAADGVRDEVRAAVERRAADVGAGRKLETTAFTSLSDAEVDEVRRAVRRFAERLRGGARVRARRAKQGRIDPHRTLRRALRTAGVPFSPARKLRRRDKPRLLLLCDVSDSVRSVACFMLEFVYAAQDLFERTRSFVFVSELGEVTDVFAREPVGVALAHAYGGAVISVNENSNYGRMLRTFEARHLASVDRRTTVVVLGDGRTNYHDDASEVLDAIRARAKALVWLCPEARAQWAIGDSAMSRYAPKCTTVLEVRCARDLEDGARSLVARR